MAPPRILQEAADELAAAAAFLEREHPGGGAAFLRAYGAKLRQLIRFPESAPLVANAPPGYRLRSFLIRRYQYAIIAASSTIGSPSPPWRTPGYWTDRLG